MNLLSKIWTEHLQTIMVKHYGDWEIMRNYKKLQEIARNYK
jgi:hypothetical protein